MADGLARRTSAQTDDGFPEEEPTWEDAAWY